MPKWNPLDNPNEVSGLSGDYYTKTFSEQDRKRKQRQQEQAQKQKQAQATEDKKKAQEEAKTRKRQEQTVNPLEAIGSALAPVGDAIQAPFDFIADRAKELETAIFGEEESAKRQQRAQEVREGVRKPFDPPTLTAKQKQQNLAENKKFKQDMDAPLDLLRVPVKAIVAGTEGVLDIATQAALDVSVNQGKDQDEYIRAAWDFGVTPKTDLGKAAAQIASFVVTTRQVGKRLGSIGDIGKSPVPEGLKGAKWWAAKGKRIITEDLIPGAIADFILSDPQDGNLSSAIQRLVPEELQDSVWFGLAADPDDNPWLNRVKSVLEGGPLNAIGNSVGALFKARKVTQDVLKAGGSKEEAIAKGVDSLTKETDAAAKADAKAGDVERVRWTEANDAELNSILSKEADLNEQLARVNPDVDPDEAVRLDAELSDLQAQKADLEARYYESADPNVQREYWETQASSREPVSPTKAVVDQTLGELADDGSGRISKAAASGNIFTDAQIRIMNLDEGQQSIIDRFQKKIDLKEIARKTGRTVDELRANAEAVLNRIDDVFKSFDDVLGEEEMIKALADAGGTLVEPKGTFATSEGAIAVKTLVDDLSKKLYDIAYGAEQLDFSSIGGFNNYDRLVDRFVGLLGIYKESASYHGSGLGGFKVRLRQAFSSGEQVMREMEEADELTYGQVKKWAEEIKSAARRGDPEAQEKLRSLTRAMVLAGGDPANTMSYAKAVFNIWKGGAENIFYNNILSGVKTAVRNFSGITRIFLDPAAIALRGAIGGDEAQVRAGLAGIGAIQSTIGDAWRIAKITWKTGIPSTWTPTNVINKAEIEAGIEMMERMAVNPLEQAAAGFAKFTVRYGQFLDAPGRLLMSTDDFVKTIIARQRITEMAIHDAILESPDIKQRGELVTKYLKKYSQYMDPQTGKLKDKGLSTYAEIGTFQDDPGKAVNMLTGFIENIPFGRFVVPFIRTPANLLKYQLEYLPLTHKFSKRYAEAVAKGDALTVAELEGRQAIGALVTATAFGLGLTGNWTGNLPVDPAERQRWKTSNIRPRSVKVGDVWISYNAIEPLNNIVAAAVDLSQIVKFIGEDNPGGMEIAEKFSAQMTLAIAASLTEKSYFANFDALASFVDVGQMTPDKVTKMFAGFAYTAAVPWASLVRGFANTFDSYQREYDNEWERVFGGNLPLIRNMAPVMIDVLTGKPMKNPSGNPWNANMPFEIAVDEKDPVKDMLMRGRYNWRDNLESYKGIKLTAEQRKFVKEEMYKAGLRRNLASLMKQDWFQEDIKAYRSRPFDPNGDPSARPRYYNRIADEFSTAKQIAFARLEATDQKFQDDLRKSRIISAEYKAGIYSDKQRTKRPAAEADSAILDQLLKF
jgi:hypothetical protein